MSDTQLLMSLCHKLVHEASTKMCIVGKLGTEKDANDSLKRLKAYDILKKFLQVDLKQRGHERVTDRPAQINEVCNSRHRFRRGPPPWGDLPPVALEILVKLAIGLLEMRSHLCSFRRPIPAFEIVATAKVVFHEAIPDVVVVYFVASLHFGHEG